MKKISIVFLSLVAIVTVSCEKCQDCHYESTNGLVEIGEICGDELKDAEANGYTIGDTVVTIHCEEH
ncbi:hypothetical protein K6119_09155 [Paracrocinitomix mangrovi]|uniref:hypothetical protein n=1 Tax=Paracrocinitomix mangrovi TaxID=2862509 RepID=UPI001C8E24B9|nr:hypothetical protein [Paracrocinitomix mangrovi]UKN03680.1 hypothetical protein K6119_09155 [Paracrocinitomix mangrovi]